MKPYTPPLPNPPDRQRPGGIGLWLNGVALAVSLALAAIAAPRLVMFVPLVPGALGAVGIQHALRARWTAAAADAEHRSELGLHFGILSLSIVGMMLVAVAVGATLLLREY